MLAGKVKVLLFKQNKSTFVKYFNTYYNYFYVIFQTICFDKTGTITENSVKLLGYQLPLEKAPDSYKTEGDKTSMLFKLFGACHSAAVLQGTHEVTGDPIDVEMVKFSGWTLGHDAMKKYNYSKLDNGKSSTRLNAIVINEFNS